MATIALLGACDALAAALVELGHRTTAGEPAGDEAVVVVGRAAEADAALALARAQRHRCRALVLYLPVAGLEPEELAAIRQPTLVIGVPGDPAHRIVVAEACWRHIPSSHLIVETLGDVPLWDRPHDLAATIDRFIREVDR